MFGLVVDAGAVPVTYKAVLDGPSESPPVASPGTGFAIIVLDSDTNFLSIKASFSDLVGTTTVAHIHCCTASPGVSTVGVAVTPGTLPGFPAGVTSGDYFIEFNPLVEANFTAGFRGALTLDEVVDKLETGIKEGKAYLNIHSTFATGGEIRGFLAPVPVPATALLFAGGLAALALVRRKA
ncbi:MAG: CHRD domain-containing protein [Alphaproteobacteria bacterium]|nr:CHRD domain-containing protein [Alphaproteobacteria bacterium]